MTPLPAPTGAPPPGYDAPPPPAPGPAGETTAVFAEDREVGRLSRADFQEFNRIWKKFVDHDRLWLAERKAWIARGGAAPYVLAENLLRYFWSASRARMREEVLRVAESCAAVGEPAVGYFASFLVLDSWPLRRPILVPQEDGTQRTVDRWSNDDVTRQDLVRVLVAIGAPSVKRLTTRPFLHASSETSRRYVLYALGKIGTDDAVTAVAGFLRAPDWQDRGSAAKALGFALPKNPKARAPLEAAQSDPDAFVRKKVQEALSGKAKSEF
jgi:hypothetical protein